MKTFDLFVVEINKRINDTMKTESGLELYIDNRFNEFQNRTTEAPVVAVPFKYDTGVEVGDTLYFHHLVVINDGQPLTGEDNHYLVRFDPDHTVNNQAIAYKSAKTGDVHPLAGWSLLERVEEREEKQSDIIDVVKLKDSPVTKGKVSFTPPWVEELGLEVGDVVGFRKNMDYRITIEEKEYYRVRAEDLMYKEI
jgi:co-chaperonin GroES (HSP10)|tara:strand:+ start:88 stop:672 length:585 start_codon:yes stop_codon:yes gene_type:complete